MPKIIIRPEYCDGCGVCIAFCKRGHLRIAEGFTVRATHPAETVPGTDCNGCRACILMCPSAAMTLCRDTEEDSEKPAQEDADNE